MAASDATGISFVELLDRLWGVPPSRLAQELGIAVAGGVAAQLSAAERAQVGDFVAFLVGRHGGRGKRRPPSVA